ncbi:hypothetical protein MHM39_03040 [Phaeobacter sp. CNT1-3]|nr:hypothetical protein [Phaeobacter sp. CNT1-3]
MIRTFIVVLAFSALAGCKADSPTAEDIEQGYLNGIEADKRAALAQYGAMEDMPAGLQLSLKMRARNVELTSCEEHPTNVGYLCIYNFDLLRDDGFVVQAGIKDIRGHVFKGDAGWLVEEVAQ